MSGRDESAGAVRLLGLGLAAPERTLSRDAAVELGAAIAGEGVRRGAIEALHRRSGVERRGIVVLDERGGDRLHISANGHRADPSTAQRLDLYTPDASLLAHRATIEALADAGVGAGSITHLVTVSCTGFEAPGFDQALMRSAGLRPDLRRTHIGYMGCHGAINGMAVAHAFASADPDARVLLCCVELCSLHFHCGVTPDRLVANALFADGGAAAVIGRADADHDAEDRPRLAGFASAIIPATEPHMRWRIGERGFEMTLSSEVPSILEREAPAWIDRLLRGHGLDRASVGGWAIHPGGPRIVRSVATGLGLPEDAAACSLDVLREHGNMSSPTVLFVLRRLRDRGVPRPWVAMAFGPGLAAEAAVMV